MIYGATILKWMMSNLSIWCVNSKSGLEVQQCDPQFMILAIWCFTHQLKVKLDSWTSKKHQALQKLFILWPTTFSEFWFYYRFFIYFYKPDIRVFSKSLFKKHILFNWKAERQKERKERADSLPKWPQQPGLNQAQSKAGTLSLPCAWQGSKYICHFSLLSQVH